MTRNIKIVVEYDGAGLAGWQRQAGALKTDTVQGLLETALERLCREKIVVHGSGRTDAGVHARRQAASFKTAGPRTPEELRRGLNALLPPQIAVLEAAEAAPDFHARFSAKAKVYSYHFFTGPVRPALLANRVWWVGPHLNWPAVDQALPHLVGRRDFAAFRSQGVPLKSTVRTIARAELADLEPGLKKLTLEADGFMRHMVRAIAGTLALVGRGKISPAEFGRLIEQRRRELAGPTAPPQGLYLEEVIY